MTLDETLSLKIACSPTVNIGGETDRSFTVSEGGGNFVLLLGGCDSMSYDGSSLMWRARRRDVLFESIFLTLYA